MNHIYEAIKDLKHKLYGPRFCPSCNEIRDVTTYELEGSHRMKTEGTTVTVSFDGAYVCTTCWKTIPELTKGMK